MKESILLIEDNPDNSLLFKYVLGYAGFNITAVESAEEATKVLLTLVPDIIISDIALPGANGNAYIKTIRQNPNTKDICAIAVSAYAREEDKQRTLDSGYDAFIEKPINAEAFAKQITEIYISKQKQKQGVL